MALPETVGTLNLKIARLEDYLRLLEQQRAMSQPYPTHQANLARQYSEVWWQLQALTQRRQELLL